MPSQSAEYHVSYSLKPFEGGGVLTVGSEIHKGDCNGDFIAEYYRGDTKSLDYSSRRGIIPYAV